MKQTTLTDWICIMFPVRRIPGYGRAAIILMLAMNCLTFFGSRLFNSSWHHYQMATALDGRIPFIKEFILIYIFLAYGQWICGYYLMACEEKAVCLRICTAEMTAKLLCLICFLLVPTTMVRADVSGQDFFSKCVRLLYESDAADNLFPSIHCLESYLLVRVLPWMKKVPGWYRKLTLPATLLVMLSTLFVKQHVIVDVFGAILVVEIGIAVSRLLLSKSGAYEKRKKQ